MLKKQETNILPDSRILKSLYKDFLYLIIETILGRRKIAEFYHNIVNSATLQIHIKVTITLCNATIPNKFKKTPYNIISSSAQLKYVGQLHKFLLCDPKTA